MNHNTVLLDLLAHIGSSSEPVLIDWDSVEQWSSGVLECFVQAGILMPASAAQSIECNSCEHRCFMDVLIYNNRAFVVCNVPEMQNQMGRIQINLERLKQWKTSFNQLASVIAKLLKLDSCVEYQSEQLSIRLGMLKSKTGRRWVSLLNQPLALEINGFKVPVNELLFFDGDVLAIDKLRIDERLNSTPLNTGKAYISSTDKREARKLKTQTKYQDWQDEYFSLQKKHPTKSKTWCAKKISTLPIAQGADWETIRKNLK